MRKLKIGLDFDGVITDCGRLKSEAAREMFGLEIPAERFKKELVVGEGLLTLEQYRELQRTVYGNREVGLRMRPVDGALTRLPELVRAGHAVKIITSRSGPQLDVAREWTAGRGLELDFTGLGYGVSKAGAAAGLDLYADDDLDKLEPLIGLVPHLFLFDWGYNRHVETGGKAARVSGWDDLFRNVLRIAEAS